jgi:hypothetical protein
MFVVPSRGCGSGARTGAPRPALDVPTVAVWPKATDTVNAMAAAAAALQTFI